MTSAELTELLREPVPVDDAGQVARCGVQLVGQGASHRWGLHWLVGLHRAVNARTELRP